MSRERKAPNKKKTTRNELGKYHPPCPPTASDAQLVPLFLPALDAKHNSHTTTISATLPGTRTKENRRQHREKEKKKD